MSDKLVKILIRELVRCNDVPEHQARATSPIIAKEIEAAFDLTEKKPREFWIINNHDYRGYIAFETLVEATNELKLTTIKNIFHVKEVLDVE